jgi:Tfp pilus assembly protein PilF
MPTIAEFFEQAFRHHQNGDLALAETYYRQILQTEPRIPEAWHFLGVIAGQTGRNDVAVEYIGQALRLNPGCAEAHNHLGNILHDQGKLKEAETSYRQALGLKPDLAEAHYGLGIVFRVQGMLPEAEAWYRQALRFKPGYAEAHHDLGNVLHHQGKLREAEACCREALRLKPGFAEAHNRLGIVLYDQGKLAEAEACFRAALGLRSGYADVYNNLGSVLHDQGKLMEAEASYREAVRLNPEFAEAHSNLGVVLGNQGKQEEVEACYREALRLKPGYAEGHLNLSLHWLRHGDFARGWPEYEWHRRTKDNLPNALPPPTWDGSALNGQTILLQTEQGTGDAFQFIRYARLLKAAGDRVVLQCDPALAPILATCPGIDEVIAAATLLSNAHVTAPLLSLPLLCRTTLETIPAAVPYLAVDPARVDSWRARLADIPGFKVGICWQGNPNLKRDRLRSVPLASFAPLAAVPGVCLVALQRGPGLEQIAQQSETLRIVDLPGRLADSVEGWLDTAALIQALDLVIGVDTAVVHLAGALAAPVWVAVPFMPDWRWLLNRDDSPWYPTLRLFRQRSPGDWPEVFQRIAAALHHLVAGAP